MDLLAGIVTIILFFREVAPQAWRISTACHGNNGLNCSFHHFECRKTEHIAVNSAEYFYKDSPRCGMGVGNCDNHLQTCCIPEQKDCSLPYTDEDLENLKKCLRSPPCVFKSPWSSHQCVIDNHLIQFSSYSVIFYECVEQSLAIDFCEGSMIGTSVSVMFDPTRHVPKTDSTCACRTSGTTDGHTPLFIEAVDVHLGNHSDSDCSSLTMDTKEKDFVYSCNSKAVHHAKMLIPVNASLPITSELSIATKNPPRRVWMRIQAKKPIRVQCQPYTNQRTTLQVNATDKSYTSLLDEEHLWYIVGAAGGGAIIIVTVITCICCIRKCRQKKRTVEEKDSHEYFEIEPTSIFSIEGATQGNEYYEIRDNGPKSDPYYSTADDIQANISITHGQNPAAKSGYDHLQLKNSDTPPVAPNYGRLQKISNCDANKSNGSRQVIFRCEYDRTSVAV